MGLYNTTLCLWKQITRIAPLHSTPPTCQGPALCPSDGKLSFSQCWDQSNLSLQNLPQIFDDLAFENIWKIFASRTAAPTKNSFLVFCKACTDWSACQISRDQPFTFLQINEQILDPLGPQNIFNNSFAVLHHLKKDWMISDGNWSHNNKLLLETLISYNAMAKVVQWVRKLHLT